MVKFTLFAVAAMLLITQANAQVKTITIKGQLTDSSGKLPLDAAKIDLFSINDSTSVTHSAITNKKGNFEFKGLNADTFRVLINMNGYPLITKTWVITDSTADLGIIALTKTDAASTDNNPTITNTANNDSNTNSNRSQMPDSGQISVQSKITDSTNFHGLASVSGLLQDKTDKSPLSGATVTLSPKRDTSIKQDALSNSKGSFSFNGVPADTFVLTISYVGYEIVDQEFVPTDSVNNLGIILIPKKTKALQGVTVIAKTPPAQQKGDTIQYNANAFKVNPDATTEDLIKKMPGITVDKNGTVTAHGDQVQKVTIDGKEMFGDDATLALRNLPSEVVDKIQVFDRLSDQATITGFDDGNSVKSINIVTKSSVKNGQFGRLLAGYGTDGRYNAGGNVSAFDGNRRISVVGTFNNINQQNFASQDLLGVTSGGSGGNFGGGGAGRAGNRGGGGGARGGGAGAGGANTNNFSVGQQNGISKTNAIGINYADKWGPKLDMQASYFFNNSNNNYENDLHSQTLIGSQTQFTDQNSLTVSKNYNNRFTMRVDYKIDSFNSILITPNLNFQNNNTVASGTSQSYYGLNDTSNTSAGRSAAQRNGYNLRNNILYRHLFAKKGRTLSVNFGTTFNKNDGQTYITQHLRFFENNIPSDSLQNQYTNNPTNGYTLNGNIAYTEPVGKKGQLQLNYAPSYTKNKADQQTFLYDSTGKGYTQFSPVLSNEFDNTVTTHNGGISYRRGASRDNQFAIGVNLQNSKLESVRLFPTAGTVNQSFTNVLPNLLYRRKLSTTTSINIMYRASVNFPTVTQLQDVLNLSNQLRISSGNPFLKQAYTNFVSARYIYTNTTKGQSFFANIFAQTQSNYISNATYIATADSAIQQGVILKSGSQLSKPVNLNGYWNLRSYFAFSQPVSFIKTNVNLSTGFMYSKLPGIINYVQTITDNYTYTAGIAFTSNISQYVDFNLSYNANFNTAKSSSAGQTNQNSVTQVTSIQFNLLDKKGWFIQNDLTNNNLSGLSAGLNQSYWLWNASFGKKFLKKQAAELKLSAFDILKQNQSIVRTVAENYIEDSRSNVLQQYFLLTFTYSLRNFGTGKPSPLRPNRGGAANF